MTLKDEGFRFILRGEAFNWIHPADVQPGDVDCTDMDDAEFLLFAAKLAKEKK